MLTSIWIMQLPSGLFLCSEKSRLRRRSSHALSINNSTRRATSVTTRSSLNFRHAHRPPSHPVWARHDTNTHHCARHYVGRPLRLPRLRDAAGARDARMGPTLRPHRLFHSCTNQVISICCTTTHSQTQTLPSSTATTPLCSLYKPSLPTPLVIPPAPGVDCQITSLPSTPDVLT